MIQKTLPATVRKCLQKCQLGKPRKTIEWIPHNFTFRYLISKELVKWLLPCVKKFNSIRPPLFIHIVLKVLIFWDFKFFSLYILGDEVWNGGIEQCDILFCIMKSRFRLFRAWKHSWSLWCCEMKWKCAWKIYLLRLFSWDIIWLIISAELCISVWHRPILWRRWLSSVVSVLIMPTIYHTTGWISQN